MFAEEERAIKKTITSFALSKKSVFWKKSKSPYVVIHKVVYFQRDDIGGENVLTYRDNKTYKKDKQKVCNANI